MFGLGERVSALSLAASELIPGRLRKPSAPLDERDEQTLPVAFECAGECGGPWRGHVPHDVNRSGRSASGAVGRVTPRDDRVSRLDDHRMLVSHECSEFRVAHRIDALEGLSDTGTRLDELQSPF